MTTVFADSFFFFALNNTRKGIREALTAEHHIEPAGFVAHLNVR